MRRVFIVLWVLIFSGCMPTPMESARQQEARRRDGYSKPKKSVQKNNYSSASPIASVSKKKDNPFVGQPRSRYTGRFDFSRRPKVSRAEMAKLDNIVNKAWKRAKRGFPKLDSDEEYRLLCNKGYKYIPNLVKELRSSKPERRKQAIYTLSMINEPQIIPYLIHCIGDSFYSVSASACEVLSKRSGKNTVHYYMQGVRDYYTTEKVRGNRYAVAEFCIIMLGKLKNPVAVPLLMKIADGRYSETVKAALRNMGDDIVLGLKETLKKNKKSPATLDLLAGYKSKEAVEAVSTAVLADMKIYVPAVNALVKIGTADAAKALAEYAERKYPISTEDFVPADDFQPWMWDSRAFIIMKLGDIKNAEALAAVEKLFSKNPDNTIIKKASLIALKKFKEK